MNECAVEFSYHPAQERIFFDNPEARFKIITKGRRFGLTQGFATYLTDIMLDGHVKCLWIDTINTNIDRYVERYFYPMLRKLPSGSWRWRQQKKELKILDSLLDMRSADRPESIEGFGYDLIIINEAGIVLKDRYLWNNTVMPMTLDYDGKIIAGGTPKGKKDPKVHGEHHLFYQLYQKGLEGKHGWTSYHFTSFDNPILDEGQIREMSEDIPPSVRRQEIYAEFIDLNENPIFSRAWWRYYSTRPDGFSRIIQSWDTAFKKAQENDFNVCTTWGFLEGSAYLLDWHRERMEFPALKKRAIELHDKWKPDIVLIEDKASGQSLIQELRHETPINLVPVKVDSDKIARANACTPHIEAGKAYLPEGALWLQEYLDTMSDFPNGAEDDTIDSTSQALNYLFRNSHRFEYVSLEKSPTMSGF